MTYQMVADERLKNSRIVIQWGEWPEHVPEGCFVMNGPRPLIATTIDGDPCNWEGEYLHGIHYAAIDPVDTQASKLIDENIASQARVVVYLDRQDAAGLLRALYVDIHGQQCLKKFDEFTAKADEAMVAGEVSTISCGLTYEHFFRIFESACFVLLEPDMQILCLERNLPSSLLLAHARERERVLSQQGESSLLQSSLRLDELGLRIVQQCFGFLDETNWSESA